MITIEEFQRLGVIEQRKMIAQDVIDQVRLKNYISRKGLYWHIISDADIHDDMSARDVILQNQCYVCGLGAIVCSIIRFGNKLSVKDVNNSLDGGSDYHKYLMHFEYLFDRDSLSRIEMFFEGWLDDDESNQYYHLIEDGDEDSKDLIEKRMICLAESILLNDNGEFDLNEALALWAKKYVTVVA